MLRAHSYYYWTASNVHFNKKIRSTCYDKSYYDCTYLWKWLEVVFGLNKKWTAYLGNLTVVQGW